MSDTTKATPEPTAYEAAVERYRRRGHSIDAARQMVDADEKEASVPAEPKKKKQPPTD